MILDEYVETKVSVGNYNYLKDLGYVVYPFQKNKSQTVIIKVEHLKKGSNIIVKCQCDKCGKEFTNRYCRKTDICYPCRRIIQMTGNTFGSANKGKELLKIRGENHPRWNPNKSDMLRYGYEVRQYTKKNFSKELQELIGNKKIGLCGVENAYQVDHIISIKEGFYKNIPIEVIGHIDNLQILSWKENRDKWYGQTLQLP